MGELSIKIKIGDREYPMKVDSAEEERLRIAGRVVNEKMKSYRDHFGIDDKQDLLAMVAFDCLVEKMRSDAANAGITNDIASRISGIDHLISTALSE
jgi:cell division protein ZapA